MDEPAGAAWLAPLPEDERRTTWRLVLPDGRYLHGGEGALVLLELLKPLRPLGRLARQRRLGRALGVVDRLAKRYRGPLGKVTPDAPPTRRFP